MTSWCRCRVPLQGAGVRVLCAWKNVWVLPTNTFWFQWSMRIISGNRKQGNYALSFLTEKVWSTWVSASKKRPAYSDYFNRKINEIFKVASSEKIFTGRTWSHGRHEHEACAIASESYYNLQPWTCSHNITGVCKLLGMFLSPQLFIDFGSRWWYLAAAYFAHFPCALMPGAAVCRPVPLQGAAARCLCHGAESEEEWVLAVQSIACYLRSLLA